MCPPEIASHTPRRVGQTAPPTPMSRAWPCLLGRGWAFRGIRRCPCRLSWRPPSCTESESHDRRPEGRAPECGNQPRGDADHVVRGPRPGESHTDRRTTSAGPPSPGRPGHAARRNVHEDHRVSSMSARSRPPRVTGVNTPWALAACVSALLNCALQYQDAGSAGTAARAALARRARHSRRLLSVGQRGPDARWLGGPQDRAFAVGGSSGWLGV
jgi:hypothetical protein